MHPDLAPHLHTPECNKLIEAFHRCHKEHPFKKFFGECNEIDRLVWNCCKKERIERSRQNREKGRMRKEAAKAAAAAAATVQTSTDQKQSS